MLFCFSPELLTKKYRYYARFIVVCLLLNYRQDVVNLIKVSTCNSRKSMLRYSCENILQLTKNEPLM